MLPLIAAMIVLLLLFRYWVPMFLAPENLLDLAQQISVNAILAFGLTLTILIGGIDLSVGAVLALIGTTTVYLLAAGPSADEIALLRWVLTGLTSLPDPLRLTVAVLAGLAVAGAFGAFNGLSAAKTKMPPFIITLATMLIARGCALRFNGGRPIHIPEQQTMFLFLGNGRVFGVLPVPVLVMVLLFLLAAVFLHRTRFGQYIYAMGGSREAARYTGVPMVRVEILVYTICALLAGVAGMIHASQLYSAEPSSGIGFELNAIAAAVVGGTSFTGGKGTMVGTLIGAILIGILDKGLNQAGVHFSLQYVIKGLVILVAVYVDVRRKR
jgi:ribose transport system permease protein